MLQALLDEQQVKLDNNQREKEVEEQRKQEEQNKAFEAEQKQRQENYKKMEKLHDIMDNLTDTDNGYFGHKNSTEFTTVQTKLYDFLKKKEQNVEFKPEQTQELKDALTAYLKHVGMGVASHHNGNVRKENVLTALNIIDPVEAVKFEGMAEAERRGKSTSKQIKLSDLMDKDSVKRDPNKKRTAVAPVGNQAKDLKAPNNVPAPKKNK